MRTPERDRAGVCRTARSPARRAGGRQPLLLVLLLLMLAGCGGTPTKDSGDYPPDAVPKVEPKSRYGNMDSYVVFGRRYHTKATSRNHKERGIASWYGPKFHGRKTSSGEIYDMHQMSAAHRTLPLPTYARVTNLENGRSAVVRINDRGPFVGGRVIDLSYAAAKKLGVVQKGTASVEIVSIDPRDHGARRAARLAAATPAKPARSPKPTRTAQAEPKNRPPSRSPFIDLPGADQPAVYLQVGAFGERGNAEQLRRQLHARLAEPILVREPDDDAEAARLYKVHVGPLDSRDRADTLGRELAALGLPTPMIVSQ